MTSRANAPRKVAIIGMACIFPGAKDLGCFWQNIVAGQDAITEAPKTKHTVDNRVEVAQPYSNRGGFIGDFTNFDPLAFGIMPKGIEGGDPDQFLALKVAYDALADAGYVKRNFNGDRAEVIMGRTSAPGVGSLNFIQQSQTVTQIVDAVARTNPQLSADDLKAIEIELKQSLKPHGADVIPALMPNILAGRIANRLGFRGRTLVLDSACASSLTAVETGVTDLLSDNCDLALAGGVHINSNKFFYDIFCGLGALSKAEQIRPFDKDADGTILGEGLGIVVLKRLEDAERDGDRIYSVICGAASSSDGNVGGILAPSIDGEALALERAYDKAGFPANTVQLLEAHGTGTIEGDVVELKAIEKVFGEADMPTMAIGSIKSMIGHAQAASGIAGLIKTSLAIYHQILPPTLNVKEPNPKVNWSKSPCYINTEARPWINPEYGAKKPHPRRAAVSAFGFGGTNAHIVLEEHESPKDTSLLTEWESEVCIFKATSQSDLEAQINRTIAYISSNADAQLKDIAYSLYKAATDKSASYKLAIVASSAQDLSSKLQQLLANKLISSDAAVQVSSNFDKGKLAFIMPGLGAAYPNMLADLCMHFPEVREVFDFVDHLAVLNGDKAIPSRTIFPASFIKGKKQHVNAAMLATMDSAVIVVLMAEWALYTVLKNVGINPDVVLGCSTGEFAALTMSGAADIEKAAPTFYKHAVAVARSVSIEGLANLKTFRVTDNYDKVEKLLTGLEVYLGADLSPKQHLLSGTRQTMDEVATRLRANSIEFQPLPVAIPYHTSLMDEAVTSGTYDEHYCAPSITAWSGSQVAPYPSDPKAITTIAKQLFRHPIRFRQTIEAMYADGVRTFVEVGPKNTLVELVGEILQDKSHFAIPTNLQNKSGITQLNLVIASLFALGTDVDLEYLFKRRSPMMLNWQEKLASGPSKTTLQLDLDYPAVSFKADSQLIAKLNTEKPRQQEFFAESTGDMPGGEDSIVANYLQSMEQFHQQLMQTQEQVLNAFLAQPNEDIQPQHTEFDAMASVALPCIAGANVHQSETEIILDKVLDLNSDLYLLDHAIGGVTAAGSEPQERVFLVPLMVALEIMAETASLLAPHLVITKLENIRALKRIRVENDRMPIRVIAKLNASKEAAVDVEIQSERSNNLLMSCQVVFGRGYEQKPTAQSLTLEGQRAAHLSKNDLYTLKTMFHGPRMQSVEQIGNVGKRGIDGIVSVRQPSDWFGYSLAPAHFLIDPLLLDNASQLVLFHLYEQNENVTALLPFHISSIDFYNHPLERPSHVTVQAQLLSLTDKGTEARVEVISDGQVLIRVNDITSKRVMLSDKLKAFVANPQEVFLSETQDQLAASLGNWSVMSLPGETLPADATTLEWLTDYILTKSEREYFSQDNKLEKRKREWLAGRIAAKDAIRAFVAKQGIKLCPADIEISYNDAGQPVVSIISQASLDIKVSIAHAEGSGIAIAGTSACGIDLEPARNRGGDFIDMAFTEKEKSLFAGKSEGEKWEIVTRIWCAKEALSKAIGQGLAGAPKTFEVSGFDASGWTTVSTANVSPVIVLTTVIDDVVIALTAYGSPVSIK
ncbi:MAG: polyketide synthase dehydratase domain-containing protein [Candidatus Obscuribacterales bacterium]|nr:polyketide synthase dehydratase domain-containing protein [Candidatus Obscuribacterales bacterium]